MSLRSTSTKPRIAIIGYGQFGRFMARHLRPYATIIPIKRDTNPARLTRCQIVIFAVPWQGLADAIASCVPHIATDALIIDVMSVKQAPLQALTAAFPEHAILGTHPIFGPQSGKNGLAGLPLVLCNVSVPATLYRRLKRFCSRELTLKVIEMTPREHDHEMAHVQGLTHLIGRALATMQLPSFVANTRSYEHLLELQRLLKDDSWELFTTIQNHNPEAAAVRAQFQTAINTLEQALASPETDQSSK